MKLISMIFGSMIGYSSASVPKVRAPQTYQTRVEGRINSLYIPKPTKHRRWNSKNKYQFTRSE